ncbi:hypothetical protein [Lysobacter capsici]|uniref:hypothetical protein n=1 Tax=Lysobacter capsici TaxID=435897 RepID=UPI001BFFF21C|nr:hypothetical protein [Lysobacter capsici]QWF18141.1 hypothetical protein KME82_05075 [Lysobacter capsici]
MKRSLFLLVAAPTLLLCGCSGAPSTNDAQAAVVAEYERLMSAGGGTVSQVTDFRLENCQKSDTPQAPGYFCDTNGGIVIDVQGTTLTRSLKGRFRFAKSDDRWQIYRP